MVLKLKTAPTVEPITLDEVKQHCRIDASEDDIYLTTLITVVRKMVEEFCGPLINQDWYQYELDWPAGDSIRLGKPRVSTTNFAITYTDTDAVTTTLDTDYYTVDDENEYFPAVVLNYNYAWPASTLHPVNPIKITFTCGYGAAATDIPEPIKQVMLLFCEHLYENREPYNVSVSGNSVVAIPWTMEALLAPYRAWGFDLC